MLGRLYEFRYFILSSIINEFKIRFARSKLGGFWAVINPLSQVFIYAVILSNLLSAKLPGIDAKFAYALYIMAGLLGWSLLSEVVTRGVTLFIEKSNLIKKLAFPKITLPAIMLGTAIVNNMLLLLSILFLFALLGHSVTPNILWLVPLTVMLAGFAVSIGIILGVLNVFIRDIGHIVPIVMQVWFWFTPIVYPETIIPERFQPLLAFNPIYSFIDSYHRVLVYGDAPQASALVISALLTVALVILCLALFRRASEEMVDEL